MRIKDPRLTDGMRDERLSRTRCMTTRAPRHRWGVLSCKASSNVWCGGDHGASQGRVSSWNGSSGELQCSVLLESSARCIAVVETVRPASTLRSAPAARGKGAPDGFGCELLVWVGLADGRLAVLTAATVQLRAVLSGHRAPVTCVCSPGAPPSSPGPGASIVLSGSEDSSMRLWDARTADCLRSIPGNGFALRAMAPVWSPDGERERCRIWSTAADQTLCIWEPRPKGEGKAVGPHTVTLNADVFELSASSDGRLVCACAGRDGAMVLDASARLRSRLLSTHMAERAMGAVLVIGKGKQIWTSGGEGGLAQWERMAASSSHEVSWSWSCVRRLSSPPLIGLRISGNTQVWGAACDGTLFAWASEAACAEACEAAARRALLGSEGSAELQQRALAYPMLRLLRQALAELSGQRDFMSTVLAGLSEGWSTIEAQRRAVLQWDKKVHLRLQAEAAKCRAADAEAAKLRADVSALRERLAGAGLEKQQVLTLKAAKDMEVSRLKKVEASLAQRAKHEQELARQLADARVQTEKLRSERDKLQAEVARVKRDVVEQLHAQSDELGQLRRENEQLAHGMHEASAESSRLLEALRRREASEAAARAEAGRMRAVLQAHDEEDARLQHEREQLRSANARMQELLSRLRSKMGEHASLVHLVADAKAGMPPPAEHACLGVAAAAGEPPREAREEPPRGAWGEEGTPRDVEGRGASGGGVSAGAASARQTAPRSGGPVASGALPPLSPPQAAVHHSTTMEAQVFTAPARARRRSSCIYAASHAGGSHSEAASSPAALPHSASAAAGHRATRPSSCRPAVWQRSHTPPTGAARAPPCARTPYFHSKGRKADDGAQTRRQVAPQPKADEATPREPPPPPAPSPAANEERAPVRAWSPGGMAAGPPPVAGVERRDAALVMQLGSLREWLQESLGLELPPGDLPTILQDGQILCRLAAALPGFAPPPAEAPPIERIHAFSAACRQLGVPSDSLLQPHHLMPGPHKSASALVNALSALAREAYVRGFLPALPPV